ncbi:MAG: hypothetical protein LQ341_001924 [Variospora aurantia]|nr:MAG: hypothetical protein LQ341_001924 [Variospora aurantia]
MPSSISAPQQHKQPSRKGKKAWRKNVDVSEIQKGLEDVREEVIKGGVVAEKASETLFTLDTTGSDQIRKSHKTSKPLKVDEILAVRSAVPAVSTHKRLGVTDSLIEPSSKRRRSNGVSFREHERLKKLAYGGESVRKDVVESNEVPSHDPWAPPHSDSSKRDPQYSYLDPPKSIKPPSTLQKAPISLLASTASLPAVPKPKAGISYNPVYQDWDALLTSAGTAEVAAERKRLADAAAEQEKQAFIAAAQNEREDNDYKTEDESAWEGFETENEVAEWLKKKRPERKTPTERNKVKRRKEAERQAKWEAQMKKREKQARQIGNIAKDVEKEAKAKASSTAVIVAKSGDDDDDDSGDDVDREGIDDSILRRRKLGSKHKLPDPPLELVLPDELRDSLRLLKPEGNLLSDRFRNIMLRGKIEARKPITQPKKAKRTMTEKWTHKDFRVPGEV